MGKFGKAVLVVVVLIGAYFGAQQAGLIGSNIPRILELDAKYGIGGSRLAPATLQETQEYEKELLAIGSPGSELERDIIAIKIEGVKMQQGMLGFAQQRKKVDVMNPDCAAAGPVRGALQQARDAIAHAKAALEKRKVISFAQGFEYITSGDFESSLNSSIAVLESQAAMLEKLC